MARRRVFISSIYREFTAPGLAKRCYIAEIQRNTEILTNSIRVSSYIDFYK